MNDYVPAFFLQQRRCQCAADNNGIVTSSNPAIRGQFISLLQTGWAR